MCLCFLCLVVLLPLMSWFISSESMLLLDVPDLSPISNKTTNLCSGEMPVFFPVLEFPFLFFAHCIKNGTNLYNLTTFMDTQCCYFFLGGGREGREGCCLYAIKTPRELFWGLIFLFFFTVGDCLYANTNCNFGLALIRDLYISWRSAIVWVIAFIPVDYHLESSESLKFTLEGLQSWLPLCHEALLCYHND